MKKRNKILSYIISFLIIFLYSYIFFKSILISTIISIITSIKAYLIFFSMFERRNKKLKMLMFREFLDIFNTNILSGYNLYTALHKTSIEIKNLFQENILLIENIDNLVLDIDNGYSIEESLIKFKEKSELVEVDIFVDSLIISINSGISLSEITNNSKNMISDNISLELEISMLIENSKKEFIIMTILPLIVLFLINSTAKINLTLIDYIIRGPIFVLFMFSFYIGYKIVNLEV